MKKTKYLVLSAAAVLAVGCKGNGKMPEINDETAVATAAAIYEAQQEAKQTPESGEKYDLDKIPFKKLTIVKEYYETYEDKFADDGSQKWEDKESYKFEIDFDAMRASFEMTDSDTSTSSTSSRTPAVHIKYDFVQNGKYLYTCENENDISFTKEKKELSADEIKQRFAKMYYEEYLSFSLPNEEDTGIWSYLTGDYDYGMDYAFEIAFEDDPSQVESFPGYTVCVPGIVASDKLINADIEQKKTYSEGSYAKHYFGSNDKEKKTSLYAENNVKVGYVVDDESKLDDRTMGDSADCLYTTDLSFSFIDNFLSKTSFSHAEDFQYRLAGQKLGEFKKRTITQTVEIKRDSNIADINLEDYLDA